MCASKLIDWFSAGSHDWMRKEEMLLPCIFRSPLYLEIGNIIFFLNGIGVLYILLAKGPVRCNRGKKIKS